MTTKHIARAVLGAAGMLTLGFAVTGCTGTGEAESTSEEPVASAPAADSPVYVDGEYEATGWYGSLPSHHDVSLTIQDDMVTAVEITTPAEDETSLGYQERFAEALPDAIIGRPLDDIRVERLAGSSGCSEGFMDALEQIKQQASGEMPTPTQQPG